MSDLTINLTPKLYAYMQNISLREPDILKKLRKKTHTMSMSQMQISPEQGQFMRLLIELLGAKKTLDIGVYTGYSTLSVALSLPEDGKIIACDIDAEWTQVAEVFWKEAGVSHKIDLRLAPAVDTLNQLIRNGESSTFDFAFIDADKINYLAYYELALTLTRPGGLIAIDNVFYGGDVADSTNKGENVCAIRNLNEKILTDDRVTISLLPIGDGLTLARKR